jgi:orotate phosphoribosyltransferase
MEEKQVLGILSRANAIIPEGHFVYTSGKHGSAYVNKDAVYPYTDAVSRLCRAFAERFADSAADVVIGPAMGGIILSQWTAMHLDKLGLVNVASVYAEKNHNGSAFEIRRGYDVFVRGHKVLVVEDVLTSGGSVKKVVEAVRAHQGEVVGVAALCNRGGVTAEDVGNVPELYALANIKLDAWDEADCPLCKLGMPVNTDVGKGREYLARKQAASG